MSHHIPNLCDNCLYTCNELGGASQVAQWSRIRLQSGDAISDPGLRRFPGEGNGNPLQYSYLGNSMGRGAWQARVHGAAEELNTTEQHNNHNNESGSRTSQGTRWK